MSEPEMVEVYDVARPRMAPVEYIGRLIAGRHIQVADGVRLHAGDRLMLRPGARGRWRPGVAIVIEDGRQTDLSSVVTAAEEDYVYRIGKPTTPSLEERVAMLERRIYPDLIVADDAEKAGRPEVARELRAKVEWWKDPEIDWTGIER